MARQSVQSGYFEASQAGFPGQLADLGTSENNNVRGYPAETAVIGGRGVVRGAAITLGETTNPLNQPSPYAVKAPTAATVEEDFVGIVVRTEAMTNVDDEAAYPAESMASVTHPRAVGALIYVKTSVATTAGDDVFMSIDAGAVPNLPVGEFTNVNGAGVIQLSKFAWYASAPAGEVGIIEQVEA